MKRITIKGLSKKFNIGFKKNFGVLNRLISFLSGTEPKRVIWVLKDISFDVNEGEVVGIIGKNGSGKSTLLRTISGIYQKDSGMIKTQGKIIPLINLNAGMQERLTMKDNIFLCGALFNLSRREIEERFDSIVKFSELSEFTNTKIYQFSSGMKQKLAFSIAIHSNPEILLIDEVFEVGDENFRKKSAEKIKSLVKQGVAVLLVSHDLELIKNHCTRIIWLENGLILKDGDSKEIIKEYLKSGAKNEKT